MRTGRSHGHLDGAEALCVDDQLLTSAKALAAGYRRCESDTRLLHSVAFAPSRSMVHQRKAEAETGQNDSGN
jgi:hypothetical protein